MPPGVSCFLRVGTDTIDAAVRYPTKEAAVEAFKDIDDELGPVPATLHIAKRKTNLRPDPDYFLKRGTNGGVVLIPSSLS